MGEIKNYNSKIINDKAYLFVGYKDIKRFEPMSFTFGKNFIDGNSESSKIFLSKSNENSHIFLSLDYKYIFNNYVRSKTEFFVNDNMSVDESLVSNNKKRLFDIIEKSLMIILENTSYLFYIFGSIKKV